MYTRKTIDLYVVQGKYSNDWEDVTSETNRKEALQRLREYRENEPYNFRIVVRREKIDLQN